MSSQSRTIVTPIPPVLDVLRRDIDCIDDQILDLLEQRYSIVKRIAWAKRRDGEQALAVRPARESRILDRLSARATHVPAEDVVQIWRSILALSAHHQRAYRVFLCGPLSSRPALLAVAAARYGEGVPVEWADDQEGALGAALLGDAILMIPADQQGGADASGLDLIGQHATGCIDHPWVLELGRLSCDEERQQDWSRTSWQRKVHQQLPAYREQRLAREIEQELASSDPVVPLDDIVALQELVAEAQGGLRMLIQAGDCAEPMEATSEDVSALATLVATLGSQLEEQSGLPVICLGRMGGQFAKPRSRTTEELGPLRLAAYRGDAVNGPGSCPQERTPDPRRLLLACEQSRRVHNWLPTVDGQLTRLKVYTSHEALLLNYESALSRSANDRVWASSAHSLWLGERTRNLDGAHVEYCRGIANPIGIKCGPTLTPDHLSALLDRLDPERTPGRIMLVSRMGQDLVEERLPRLMAAVQRAGRDVLWLCDPMHGNNRTANGTKVRLVPEVIAEAEGFARVSGAMGVHAGGLHLEVTPHAVLECVERIEEAAADRPFASLCDPRLNAEQAARVVGAYVAGLGDRS